MPITSTVDGTAMPAGTDAFNPNVQLKAYQDGNAKYNKHRIYPDVTARDADTYPTEGWTCEVLTTDLRYRHNGTSWDVVGGGGTGTLTLGGTITVASGYTTKLEKNGNIVTLAFTLQNSAVTGTATIPSGTTIATLPAGFRPTSNPVTSFMGYNNSGTVFIAFTIDTSGVIRAYPATGLGGTALLIGSASFSVA